jgi:hypothetical protein
MPIEPHLFFDGRCEEAQGVDALAKSPGGAR